MSELSVTNLAEWRDDQLFEELERIDKLYFILKKRLNYYVTIREAVTQELERRKNG